MKKVTKVMVIMFITNLILSFMQIIAGIIGNSAAVVADGVHTITDLITDVVALIGTRLSNKKANKTKFSWLKNWWRVRDSDPRHVDYDSTALPTELTRRDV